MNGNLSTITPFPVGDFAPSSELAKTTGVQPSAYLARSRIWNRVIALVLIIPALPLIAITALLIRITSTGPIIFRQRRVGVEGRHFTLFKLRTMRHDAEAISGPVWATRHDPRVTKLGRILRTLHIDEFPQLWNVLKGEMAIVGPRPERPEFVKILVGQIPGYVDRLTVLPGITGLAQIQLPPDTDVEGVRQKQAQDLEYIRTATPLLDLRILLCTALRLCGLKGSLVIRLLGFKMGPVVPEMTATENPKNRQLKSVMLDVNDVRDATPPTNKRKPR